MPTEPTPADLRVDLTEILLAAADVEANGYNPDRPVGRVARETLREHCHEWLPAAARRAVAAEARVRDLEARADADLHRYEEVSSRCYFLDQRLDAVRGLLADPPPGTAVEYDAAGRVRKVHVPGLTDEITGPGQAGEKKG